MQREERGGEQIAVLAGHSRIRFELAPAKAEIPYSVQKTKFRNRFGQFIIVDQVGDGQGVEQEHDGDRRL